jgi:hypothetical protein
MREKRDVGVQLSAFESSVRTVKREDEAAVSIERRVDSPVVLQLARLSVIKEDSVREARGSSDVSTKHNERRSTRGQTPPPMAFAAAD